MLAVVVIWAILSGQTLTVYAIADEPFTGWHVAVDSDQRVVECELMPIDGFSHWASLSWDKAGPGIEQISGCPTQPLEGVEGERAGDQPGPIRRGDLRPGHPGYRRHRADSLASFKSGRHRRW